MQCVQIVPVDEEIQIHRGSRHAVDPQGESADGCIPNLKAVELGQERLENLFKIHAAILGGPLQPRNLFP